MAEYGEGFHVLVDASAIVGMDATGNDMYQLGVRAANDTNRFAIVVTDAYASAWRLYEVVTNWREERVAVFSERHPAVEWLAEDSSATAGTAL